MKTLIISTVATVALTATAWAQAPDPHHPEGALPGAAQPAPQLPPGMAGMADMMRMMQSMRMMGPDMGARPGMGAGMSPGMGMIDHIEGRIAFLRTELKITDAQTSVWNAFADALRTNAQKLATVRPAMMPAPQQTLPERMDAQERWLAARLQGARAIKTAFAPLYGALSDEQKKTAAELLGPHLGLAMPGARMRGPMQPGQMERGQTGPGSEPAR